MIAEDILTKLRRLNKDKNWLLNFILDNGELKDRTVRSGLTLPQMIFVCSDNLKAKILEELKGIERDYESNGFPEGFDFARPDVLSVQEAAILACNEQSITFSTLSPIHRLFVTHYRCARCKLVPLNHLDFTNPKRARCKLCGHTVTFRNSGKIGRIRFSAAKYLNGYESKRS